MYFSAEYKEGFESLYKSKCFKNSNCNDCISMDDCSWCSHAKLCLPSKAANSISGCSDEPSICSIADTSPPFQEEIPDVISKNKLYRDQVPDKIPPPAVYMSGKLGYSPQTIMAEINNIQNRLNVQQQQSQGDAMGYLKDSTAADATPIKLSNLPPDLMGVEFDYKMKKMTDMIYEMKKTLDTPNASMSGIKTSISDVKKELKKIEKKTGDVDSLKKLMETQNKSLDDVKRGLDSTGRKSDSRFDELKRSLDAVDKKADKPNISIAELRTLVGDLSTSIKRIKSNQPVNWIQIPGTLKQISSDDINICGVDPNSTILCKDALDKTAEFSTVNTTGAGRAVNVSVSNGNLYEVNTNSLSFFTNNTKNPTWTKVGSQALVQVKLDGNTACGVTVDGKIFCTDSITIPNWKSVAYTATPTIKFKHVSVKGKKLYAISTDSSVYYVDDYTTPIWKKVRGKLNQLDLDTNHVCGVTERNNIVCSSNIANPEWSHIRGKSKWVSVNDNELYAIHPDNNSIWYTNI